MNLTQRLAKREAELAAALEPADPCPHCNGTGRRPPEHEHDFQPTIFGPDECTVCGQKP